MNNNNKNNIIANVVQITLLILMLTVILIIRVVTVEESSQMTELHDLYVIMEEMCVTTQTSASAPPLQCYTDTHSPLTATTTPTTSPQPTPVHLLSFRVVIYTITVLSHIYNSLH